MGIIRGGALAVVGGVLLIALIFANIFLVFSSSLKYDSVKDIMSSTIKQSLSNSEISSSIDLSFNEMQIFCGNDSDMQYSNYVNGYNMSVSCKDVRVGKEAIIDSVVNSLVREIYYKDYSCDFIDCFEKETIPLFLFSAKAHAYWNKLFLYSLLACLILFAFSFFLVENRSNSFLIAGIFIILSSVLTKIFSTLVLKITLSNIFSKLNSGIFNLSVENFLFLLKEVQPVFIKFIIFGVIIFAFGILIKIFKIGFSITAFFEKIFSKGKNEKNIKEEKAEEKKEDKEKKKPSKKKK